MTEAVNMIRTVRSEAWRASLAGLLPVALLGLAYALLDMGWRDAVKAAAVYGGGLIALRVLLASTMAWRLRTAQAWSLLFVFDLGIKGFLVAFYQTEPDAVLVIEAISNTSSAEASEFTRQYLPQLTRYAAIAGGLALAMCTAVAWSRSTPKSGRGAGTMLVVLACLFAVLHLNPTFRRSNPLFYWPRQVAVFEQYQQRLTQLDDKRRVAERQLPDWAPAYGGPARHTLALVLGESTSRWNWSLYGYPRRTTPELEREAGELLEFQDVISATSGTVSSFRQMLTPRQLDRPLDDESAPSVLLLAKAAGYRVWWISNQHDRYINPRFAAEADVVEIVNTGGARGDRSLDEAVVPAWQRALADPHPRKLIVVHLLGAHPHYELRSPDHFKRFSGVEDPVENALESAGRSAWVRHQRDSYDNAMLYQDHVLAQLLRSFRADLGPESGSFLYTSDHAQEVGHTRDFAGHAPTEAGYVVPLLLWNSPGARFHAAQDLTSRPFQSDVLDWTLLSLMHVHTRRDQPELVLVGARFRPRPRSIEGRPYSSGYAQARLAPG